MYDKPPQDELEAYELLFVAKWAGVPLWELVRQPVAVIDGYRAALWIENRLTAEAMRKHGPDK